MLANSRNPEKIDEKESYSSEDINRELHLLLLDQRMYLEKASKGEDAEPVEGEPVDLDSSSSSKIRSELCVEELGFQLDLIKEKLKAEPGHVRRQAVKKLVDQLLEVVPGSKLATVSGMMDLALTVDAVKSSNSELEVKQQALATFCKLLNTRLEELTPSINKAANLDVKLGKTGEQGQQNEADLAALGMRLRALEQARENSTSYRIRKYLSDLKEKARKKIQAAREAGQ